MSALVNSILHDWLTVSTLTLIRINWLFVCLNKEDDLLDRDL